MKFQQKRAAYALLFTLSCVYGILVTLFSAIRSPVVCRDASQFLIRIRNVGMTVVSGIDNIAAFFSSFLALISYPEARVVFSGLVYLLVTIIIYGVMIAVVFYAIRRYCTFFKENLTDEYTIFIIAVCIAGPVFFAAQIKEYFSVNLIIAILLLSVASLAVRSILEMKDEKIRKDVFGLVFSVVGMGMLTLLFINIAGVGIVIGIPIVAVILMWRLYQ